MKAKTFVPAGIALLALGAGSATAGPCTTEIDNLAKVIAAKDAGSGPTSGTTGATRSEATPPAEHPPTAVMRQQTEGKATSPEDVRRQIEGQPPAAQQGTTGVATTGGTSEASNMLSRARELDRQGKEAECMNTLQEAKQMVGAK
jgi:hypothetical protein